MVADAEAHRSEDAALRAEVDTRNELDTVVYQVQRTLDERPPRTAPDRCGVSLPARLRQGSGEHCYVVIFPRAARSL